MTALIILACVLAYLGAALVAARVVYGHRRAASIEQNMRDYECLYPRSNVPAAIREWDKRDRGLVMFESSVLAMTWAVSLPLWAVAKGVAWFLESSPVRSPAEIADRERSRERRITELEAENERLRRQQEGRLG